MANKATRALRAVTSGPEGRARVARRARDTAAQAVKRTKDSLGMTTPEDYLAMQRRTFDVYADHDGVSEGDISADMVVGSWKEHNQWADYEDYLMRYVPTDESWVALDYGCGPGRNIARWSPIFKRVDGVDIAPQNIKNAEVFLRGQVPAEKWPNLYVTSGDNCGAAEPGSYDFVFSTICMQHICVHSVRTSIMASMFEMLKPGGRISIQMGYGVPSPKTVGYYEDNVTANATNRGCDAAIESPDQPRGDLESIGFVDFEHWIRPVGPGDLHPNWIFFTARKPG